MATVAGAIVDNASVNLQATKLMLEYGNDKSVTKNLIGIDTQPTENG
ncbi:hypothetical protein [uncultured Helicobacter sp.]|nr:hypothetical protein [uncultured Helicobacter sp.]